MDTPKNQPLSKDLIIRRTPGEKQTLGDKVRDVAIAVKNDWKDMKEIEKNKSPQPAKSEEKRPYEVPSYKKGGRVKRTGLALLHKGEHVIPKNKVKKVSAALKKSGRKKHA